MSSRRKPGSRFIRIDQRVYASAAFQTLPGSAMKLWVLLRSDFTPQRNGRIVATLATLRAKGWRSSDLLRRMLPELVDRGLLAYTSKAGPNIFQQASKLRFTDEPCLPDAEPGVEFRPATNDYLTWRPPSPDDGDESAKAIKPFFARSGIRTSAHPASGLALIRHPDHESEKPIRHPDHANSHLKSRPDSAISQIDELQRRDPASGHTLESASSPAFGHPPRIIQQGPPPDPADTTRANPPAIPVLDLSPESRGGEFAESYRRWKRKRDRRLRAAAGVSEQ